MTGRELLAELTKLSNGQLDLEVRTEGCDCYGDVEAIVVEGEKAEAETIVLHRGPETRGLG